MLIDRDVRKGSRFGFIWMPPKDVDAAVAIQFNRHKVLGSGSTEHHAKWEDANPQKTSLRRSAALQ
jgi:hypothetical protein